MSNFNIVLLDEAGRTEEANFDTLEECAAFALQYPEYGISLYGDYDQLEWERELEAAFS
jgi:hypothetical protein